jgi:signal transduction histidine kinase/CheY-like chemotaxis protein
MALERRRADVIVRENEQRLETLVEARTAELKSQTEERLKVEDALRQSQKMEAIGQLTGGIAHDFNNLLQGILGALTLTKRSLLRGSVTDAERFLGSIETSAKRAAGLTHSLLAFARRQPLDPIKVDINQLATNMADMIRRTVGEAIAVKLLLAEGLWLCRCDINQLDSAILNLAINARDAMPNGGTLTIETCNISLDSRAASRLGMTAGRYASIVVSDTGTGMSQDVMARVFEPFFTTKLRGQGTGLGLSMVYGFARQSQGSVKIKSEVGQGTTVQLYIPEFTGRENAAVTDNSVSGTPAAKAGEVVLVVEDDDEVRSQIIEVLLDLGYTPLQASDGPAGLEILRSAHRIDLLVTDMGLPGLNGRQVADGGRDHRPGLKVLFMTGYAENAAVADGFLEPGMKLLTKPFDLDALAERVREMIQLDLT